ncbi:class I SAM-dependent methyltransferase [Nocardia transvalensis]|uniref:class I SAM-dependent methyltransferase n=1 Tax=Nocardia transvalensis TaxID=37333 RepID=UPI002B4B5ECF|nr:class I SAM-dependent methyltransferase [Nocardia transvalensis]
MGVSDVDRWNVNIHFHDLLAEAVSGASAVLDVGCGEGMLARRLRRQVSKVTAIDADETSIDLARAQSPMGEIDYVHADFLDHPFAPESFDGIVSVATLHHMDATVGLTRMIDLLRPGGTLAVVGLARTRLPADLPWILASVPIYAWRHATKKEWAHPSPIVWPPPETYQGMRRITENTLPGARFRRHLLPRYSIVWTKPSR